MRVTCTHLPALYRQCYRTVGAAYRWSDRWDWSDEEIRAHLADPNITFHVATRAGALAGYYELRRVTEDESVEVAYFGLAPNDVACRFVPYKTEAYEVDSVT
jgi:hypothetical protein